MVVTDTGAAARRHDRAAREIALALDIDAAVRRLDELFDALQAFPALRLRDG